jgi:ATP/maltotriose-dependent transcriptional regulator MalT
MGRLDEAEALAQTCRDVALSSESHEGAALFGILLGEVMLRQGRPLSAARVLRDAAGLLAERDPLGYRPWALTALARARAQTGDVTGAVECLAEARQIQPISRHFEISRFLGEYEVAAASGSSDKAVQWATEGAEWARGCGMVIEEAMALDAAVRLAPQPEVAARMKELATLTDSPLARLMAEHAAALIGADADSLEAASLGFARMSCWWHAAEAAAAAALVHQRRRQKRAAQAASRAAFDYASRCEGARTPFVTALTAPTGLTRREAEIATLAAAGRSSKEIATRLFLSPRTVESHLHHVYVKLGVTDRAGLAGILGDGAR